MSTGLPRLDWLLLLQDECPETVQHVLCIGGDDATVLALGRVAGAQRVDTVLPTGGVGYDLVMVVSPPDGEVLARALHHVRPGGIACVQSPRHGLPVRTVCRVLDAAGLTVRGRWAMLPDAQLPKRYLPVGCPPAWQWYLRNLFVASTPALRAQALALRAAAQSAELASRLAPAVTTLAVRAPAARTPTPVPMLITSGYDSGSRAVVLPFEPGSAWPAEVVKVARRQELRDATRREHTRLTELRRNLPADLVRALPRAYGLVERERSTAARQEAARGPLLSRAASRWAQHPELAERDLAEVGAWLAGLHLATAGGPVAQLPPRALSVGDAWLRGPLHRLHSLDEVPPPVHDLVAAAADHLDALSGELPSVVQHYDVGPWNIVRSAGGLVLLDWELDLAAGRTGWGPPLVDFLYYACAWYNLSTRRLSRAAEIEGLVEAFATEAEPAGWPGRLLARNCETYLQRTGLPAAALRPLVVACWLERAVTARSRWERLREGTPDPKGLEFLAALAGAGFLDRPRAAAGVTAAAAGRSSSAFPQQHAR